MPDEWEYSEQPTAFRVDAMGGDLVFSDPLRKKSLISEKYQTESLAMARKVHLQANGYIASVTPVYPRWTKRVRRKLQTAPFGHEFRKEWHLFEDDKDADTNQG